MGLYQDLRGAGFKESPKGPVVISGLTEVIERIQADKDKILFSIMPGFLVPEARPENYDLKTFENNYVVFLQESN